MTTAMPVLETKRLIIRPFVMEDLEAIHHALSRAWGVPPEKQAEGLPRRERWLRWTVASYEELAILDQPPYGDRAIVLKQSVEKLPPSPGGYAPIIGSVGFVPSMGPFGQLPGFPADQESRHFYPEVGLFWAVDPAHQGKGYATEAARALIDFGFNRFNLGRIVATTEHMNHASIAVMRKLGMRILQNPLPQPEWFQIVGVLDRPQT
jgi:RimJ/RimL family protein N-acetyltransferase